MAAAFQPWKTERFQLIMRLVRIIISVSIMYCGFGNSEVYIKCVQNMVTLNCKQTQVDTVHWTDQDYRIMCKGGVQPSRFRNRLHQWFYLFAHLQFKRINQSVKSPAAAFIWETCRCSAFDRDMVWQTVETAVKKNWPLLWRPRKLTPWDWRLGGRWRGWLDCGGHSARTFLAGEGSTLWGRASDWRALPGWSPL